MKLSDCIAELRVAVQRLHKGDDKAWGQIESIAKTEIDFLSKGHDLGGSNLHDLCQLFMNNAAFAVIPDLRMLCGDLKSFIEQLEHILLAEATHTDSDVLEASFGYLEDSRLKIAGRVAALKRSDLFKKAMKDNIGVLRMIEDFEL